MNKIWGKYLHDKKFRSGFFIAAVILASVLFILTIFLKSVEARIGVGLYDPLLTLFNPVDVTWIIFIIIYGSLIAGIIFLALNPVKLIFAFQAYAVLVLLRMAAMYIVALEPPVTMIPLADPFAEYFTTGSIMTKDLFFSGHTATLFFLFLITKEKLIGNFFFAASIAIGVLVLMQHVHYSIDVFAAPFFTYGAYKLVLIIHSKFNLNYI